MVGQMLCSYAEIKLDNRSLREDVGDLRERMVRLEGLFEGHVKGETR